MAHWLLVGCFLFYGSCKCSNRISGPRGQRPQIRWWSGPHSGVSHFRIQKHSSVHSFKSMLSFPQLFGMSFPSEKFQVNGIYWNRKSKQIVSQNNTGWPPVLPITSDRSSDKILKLLCLSFEINEESDSYCAGITRFGLSYAFKAHNTVPATPKVLGICSFPYFRAKKTKMQHHENEDI